MSSQNELSGLQLAEISFTSMGLVGTIGCQLSDEDQKILLSTMKQLNCEPVATYRGSRHEETDETFAIFVALVAEGETLGHWGTILSNAVLFNPPLLTSSIASRATSDDMSTRRVLDRIGTATTLSYRLMLVKASRRVGGGEQWTPLHFLDVDRKANAPSLVQLEGSPSLRTATIDLRPFLAEIVKRSKAVHPMLQQPSTATLRPQLIGRGGVASGAPGRALVLTFYGINPRHNFEATEWRSGLDVDAVAALPEHATSLFDIVDVELQVTRPPKAWAVPPTTTTALYTSAVVSSSSSSPQRTTSVANTTTGGSRKVRGGAQSHAAHPLFFLLLSKVIYSASLSLKKKKVVLSSVMRDDDGASDTTTPPVRVPLLPDLFSDHTTGTFTVPVWIGSIVTALHVQYLEVTSFVHPANHAARVRSDEGLQELTLDTLIGHRGLGKTYTSSDATVMQQKLAENSLESFSAAHARGCQWVELDVMMTKDYTPILFHDAILQVAARGKQRTIASGANNSHSHDDGLHHHHRVTGVTPYDTLPVAVHQLTYRQLNNALTRAYQQEDAAAPSCRLRELLIKHWLELLDIAAMEGHRKDPTLVSPLIAAQHRGSGSNTANNQSLSTTPPLGNSLQTPRLTSSSAFLRRIDDLGELELPHGQTPPGGEKPPSYLRSPLRHNHNNNSAGKKKGQFVDASKHQRYITNHIPTLQELFDTTPSTLRVNLEVKFPFQPKADHHLYLQTHHFEVNDFVDAILTVVFDHVQRFPTRELVFSSFDPDVCIALMLKQCRFHVLFLSDTEEHVDLKDYRSHTVETAIQFAHGHHMSGISIYGLSLLDEADKHWQTPPSSMKTWARELEKRSRVASMDDIHTMILSASATDQATHMGATKGKTSEKESLHFDAAAPQALWSSEKGRRIVKCSHAHSLKVWTWGDRNSDPIFAFVQSREMLVDAVISDNVPLWSNASVGKLQSRPPSGSLDVLAT
ncbi:Hypothetical protein, putative [Bodo saltans]|uniref:GP-PDE domain-containing protein n=1 Tax=Bodo saltans TaxID=75058 RepID=A0A0S4J866_BODSA|nr:Hypothetical protein, putative [Bodo saltans]|eukprot:CUG86708.1 Hypothetical protein, putative [Bodo saltans]